jgi:ABC-type antimicrobial peptide transport system permease subunit
MDTLFHDLRIALRRMRIAPPAPVTVLSHALVGVAVGIVGALALGRTMRSMLFGITAFDPVTFAGVALLLGATALVASYLPARRAARIDPLVALRAE